MLIFNGIVCNDHPSRALERHRVAPQGPVARRHCALALRGSEAIRHRTDRRDQPGALQRGQDPGGSAGRALALLGEFSAVPVLFAQPDAVHCGALCAGLGLGRLSMAASAFFCSGVRMPA